VLWNSYSFSQCSDPKHSLIATNGSGIGLSTELLNPVLDGILQQPSLQGLDIQVTDDADGLFALCPQSVWGMSNCFAAAIFTALNSTNVDYIIALDGQLFPTDYSITTSYNNSLLSTRILPLQWAIESQVGNLSTSSKPFEQPWQGYFYAQPASVTPKYGPLWLALVGMFVAPFFILILVGVAYHIAVFVATERQTGLADLQRAQMVTDAPRIISTVLSFLIIYFPGFLVSSILLTQLLFTNTSDILFLFLTLLAGISLTISSHFLASFFGKAQLAGLYISTFIFALSLVSYAASLLSSSPYNEIVTSNVAAPTSYAQILILSLIFPPYTWATLIGDVANREFELNAFSLSPVGAPNLEELALGIKPQQSLQGYLYVIFFIVQIVMYSAATYWIERTLWGVKRNFEPLDASSDVAIRVTNLSKTYFRKRPWYWPFKASGAPTLAVRSLDLEVKKGSVTFLLGPNGGGKTTTLKCVAGMTAMDSGSRLEINEAGTVFGICPQHNVRHKSVAMFLANHHRSFGQISPLSSI
jgi:ATP-binding cassette, subfamily A (ABC1), member 3